MDKGIEALKPGKYAILYRDNWDGEGDTYLTLANLEPDGRWLSDETGKELLEYEGDEILKAWPLDDDADTLALITVLEQAQSERDKFNFAHKEWNDKTEWVQKESTSGRFGFQVLGMHRADVMTRHIDELESSLEERTSTAKLYRLALDAAEQRIKELEAGPHCVKPRIAPHQYRECINELTVNARKYGAAGQLRERLSYALSKYVEPDHPHTRTSGGTVEGGE